MMKKIFQRELEDCKRISQKQKRTESKIIVQKNSERERERMREREYERDRERAIKTRNIEPK